MADISTNGAGASKVPLQARTVKSGPPAPIMVGAPNVCTDRLSLQKPAEGQPQYFDHGPVPGHKNVMTLSMILKQPLWADDRTKITADQWAQMPESQRAAILAMVPTDPAKAQFLSSVDPALAKAQAEVGSAVKKAWDGAQAWSQSQTARAAARTTDAATQAGNLAAHATDASAPAANASPGAAQPPTVAQDAQVDRLNKLIEAQPGQD